MPFLVPTTPSFRTRSKELRRILKDVSRSFYLSIILLPKRMQEPVALGYLLARASDTVADTTNLPPAERLAWLDQIEAAIKELSPDGLPALACAIGPRQSHEGEKALLERLPQILALVSALKAPHCEAVQAVVSTIIQGQKWDVETFEQTPGPSARVGSDATLELYTYRVAGCVGEFWTRVGLDSGVGVSAEKAERLRDLGRKYGQGLQLVNILRDLGEDLGRGRCYLPRPSLLVEGWNDEGPPNRHALGRVAEIWRNKAQEWVGAGKEYARHLPWGRVRWATLLPALLAEETLQLLDQAGEGALDTKVKISRKMVRRCAWRALGKI